MSRVILADISTPCYLHFDKMMRQVTWNFWKTFSFAGSAFVKIVEGR